MQLGTRHKQIMCPLSRRTAWHTHWLLYLPVREGDPSMQLLRQIKQLQW